MARNKRAGFFVGFGFAPDSELDAYYRQIRAELIERCGAPAHPRAPPPHLTIFPSPPAKEGLLETTALWVNAFLLPPALELVVEGWGWFAAAKSTLYLGVRPSPEFEQVVARLETVLGPAFAKREPFVPHVSFARRLSSEERERIAAYLARRPPIPFRTIALGELALYTRKDGAYQAHARRPFARS